MGTSRETADFFLEQAGGGIALRKMFGEYAVQAQGKTLGLICDDALFVRQLPEITAFLSSSTGDPVAGQPYPGAKPWWRIEPDAWEEAEWLRDLLRLLDEILPAPAPKRPRRSKAEPKD